MTNPASLRDWLHASDGDRLRRILEARGDVLAGAPVRDVDDLAERLCHPASVAGALLGQPLPAVQVLMALASCGPRATARRTAELLAPVPSSGGSPTFDDLGSEPLSAVRRLLDALADAGLLWPAGTDGAPSDDIDCRWCVNPGLLDLVPDPLGLGRPATIVVQEVPARVLERVLKQWGHPAPTRKDQLVAAVADALAEPEHVRRVVAQAPDDVVGFLLQRAQRLADRSHGWILPRHSPDDSLLDGGGPAPYDSAPYDPTTYDPTAYLAEQRALRWAQAHGLAFSPWGEAAGYGPVNGLEIPAEVVLALLGPGPGLRFDPVAPLVQRAPAALDQVTAAGAAAVTETLALAMALLERLDREPLTGLKSGGVGAREIARLTRALGAPTGHVRLVLELAGALGLVGADEGNRIRTQRRFASWRRSEPSRRAAELVVAWLTMHRAPSIERDPASGRSLPALVADDAEASSLPLLRHALLKEVASVPGQGVTATGPLADLLAWRLPYVAGASAPHAVATTWDEASHLGLVALGAMTPAGLATLEENPDSLLESLEEMLPATHSQALLGSDLTVVVPGSPAPAVVDLLDAVAVREARGSAATWRLTPDSVRRALDEGHDAEDLLARLRAVSATDVPQALEYLVRDVARRHGHVGVQATAAVVVGDDHGLLAEIAASRNLRRLALRQVAPNVLVSPVAADDVLIALRGAGYLPVPLDETGAPVVQVSARHSVRGERAGRGFGEDEPERVEVPVSVLERWASEATALPPEDPAEAAGRLLRGERPREPDGDADLEDQLRGLARRLTGPEVRHLARAIREGGAVQMRYRSSSGGVTVRVVSDLLLVGPHVMGWCHLRQGERSFSIPSILSVVPA